MNDLVTLDVVDTERLLYAIDTSLKVHRRHQFRLWVQGGLQRFLPHGTLVCAFGDLSGARYKVEVFAEGEGDPRFLETINHPVDGLLPRLIAEWQRAGREPSVVVAEADAGRLRGASPLPALLQRLGLSCVAGHGTSDFSGKSGSFFAFLHIPQPVSPRLRYMLEVFIPYLRTALFRFTENEVADPDPAGAALPRAQLTGRELEVLRLMYEGKTNHEIAILLDISPLTVKNHVANVLRKLNASNRTAASAKAADYLLAEALPDSGDRIEA